jgi:calcineurin-like phosphoesterase family protein
MTEELIRAWNEVVQPDDDVYHLGDVSLGRADKTLVILNRLNGNIHLITGNHEKSVLDKEYTRNRFVWIKSYYELNVETTESNFEATSRNKNQSIVLCHYAFRVWNKSHYQSIHLYGHSHDNLDKEGVWGKSMDVGVDSAYRILGEYRPFSLKEVIDIMDKRKVHVIEHHGK